MNDSMHEQYIQFQKFNDADIRDYFKTRSAASVVEGLRQASVRGKTKEMFSLIDENTRDLIVCSAIGAFLRVMEEDRQREILSN